MKDWSLWLSGSVLTCPYPRVHTLAFSMRVRGVHCMMVGEHSLPFQRSPLSLLCLPGAGSESLCCKPSGHFRGCWFIFLPLHATSSLKCLLEGDSDFQSQSSKDPGVFSGCEVLRSPCVCLWLVVGALKNPGVLSEIYFEIKSSMTFL